MSEKPFWVHAMTNPADFQAEQDALGRCWTFLGLKSQIPAANDWFRARLGGKSIFVQHFEQGIRAFENRCAHRAFPLRNAERGTGPVVCGFHHWRYNADGLALGIPNCPEMFGKTPREMNARLEPVEIALCGEMIFGRFGGGPAASLPEWLGPAWDILAHVSARSAVGHGKIERVVSAHWKLMLEISLDDYHIVAVHPTTFGKNGYLPPEITRYFRFSPHSAYMPGGEDGALQEMSVACRNGSYFPTRYRIFQIFPTLIVALVHATNYLGEGYWYVMTQQLVPEAHDRTRSITRYWPFPFPDGAGAMRKLARAGIMPWMNAGFRYYLARVHGEDNAACEQLQSIAGQNTGPPRLALQEKRIGWFNEEYLNAVGAPPAMGEARAEE